MYIYILFMEYKLRPWVSWSFLLNHNHLSVVLQKNSIKPRVAVYIP